MLHFTAPGESLSISIEGNILHPVASPANSVCTNHSAEEYDWLLRGRKSLSFPWTPFWNKYACQLQSKGSSGTGSILPNRHKCTAITEIISINWYFLTERADFLRYTKAAVPNIHCMPNNPPSCQAHWTALSAPMNAITTVILGVWHHRLNHFM